jgi:CheY-like chemotaxis protein
MKMAKRILLVDDSKTALMMEQMLLDGEPYELAVARDGQEAIDKALAERPDLILMDVVMPGMSGFEAVERLRAAQPTRDVPIIMVTTRGEGENVERGYAVGCTDYVTKPIDGAELIAKIKTCLGE